MTPDAAVAICALPPGSPERHWRLLAALATFRTYPDGSVRVSRELLATTARLHRDTVKAAVRELAAAGVIAYRPGDGRGHWSAYRIQVKGGSDAAPPFQEYPSQKKGGSVTDKGGGAKPPDLGKQDDCFYKPLHIQPRAPLRAAPPAPADLPPERSRTMRNRKTQQQGPGLWPAAVPDVPPAVEGVVVTEPARNAQTLVAEWVEHCRQPPLDSIKGQVARRLKKMLDQGAPYGDVRRGLADWHKAGLAPTVLDSFVHQAMQGPGGGRRRGPVSGNDTLREGMALAERLDARAAGQ